MERARGCARGGRPSRERRQRQRELLGRAQRPILGCSLLNLTLKTQGLHQDPEPPQENKTGGSQSKDIQAI
jgi:hypothetical protein